MINNQTIDKNNISLYRIIDANLNRAAEGMRVIEDYYRFVNEKPELQQIMKNLRHELRITSFHYFENKKLLDSRNTDEDSGSRYSIDSEKNKNTIEDVLISNFKRIQEALRCLEEYSKIINPNLSEHFKTVRFKVYKIEINMQPIKS